MVSDPTWLAPALRTDTAWRTTGPPRRLRRWVCGFTLKPTTANGYLQRRVPEYVVVYVLRGSGRFVDGEGRSHDVVAGDLLHHVPHQTYSLIPDPDGQWAEVFVSADESIHDLLVAAARDPASHPMLHPGLDAGLVERFEHLHRSLRESDDVLLERAPAWLLEIILFAQSLERRGGTDPDAQLIEHACHVLGKDLGKRQNLPHIAADMSVSYERFRKLFTAKMGISPRAYRIRRRIDRARELIQQGGLSNKAVAYELGYTDPFTFSKQFKSVVGVSPAVFRKRMR